ncbi:MAG: T9SS type A sorting domain-containing protein [Prevotellaceae bacterium]|jgi:hypothetical protein|nr:T9SS type A sorting domain-containing protein [Prevotellaceae bacterium]
MKKKIILLLMLIHSINGLSQVQSAIYENKDALLHYQKIKTSLSKSIPVKKMQSFDVTSLLNEDKQNEDMQDVPFRFGYGFDVDYTLDDGVWETQGDNNIWSLKISSEGAHSLNFIFEELYLTERSELYIFSADGYMVYGPVTKEQNISGQNFLSDLIVGDDIVIQLIEPVSSEDKSFLRISKVVHGYINMFTSLTENNATQSLGESANCNNDVACYSSWVNESNAVALVLLSNGTEWCSGSLLNNTNQDYRLFFLSAFHCIDIDGNGTLSTTEKNNSQSWTFRFNYKKSTCNGSTVTSYITYAQANFRAAWANTDFLLMELIGMPVAGRSFLGWDRTGNNSTSGASIHHPRGDVMKISFDNNTITPNPNSIPWQGSSFISPANTHWTGEFDNGIVEKGSSGSPLFGQNKHVVGQLHGGKSNCTSNTVYYGQFHKSWTGGGTNDTRLSNWLDPTGSGVLTLNTINPPTIFGPSNLCINSSGTFTVTNPPASYEWATCSNLVAVSTSGNSKTFKAIGSGLSCVRILVDNKDVAQYNIWLGEPEVPVITDIWRTASSGTNVTYAFLASNLTGSSRTPYSCEWRASGLHSAEFTSDFPEGSYTFTIGSTSSEIYYATVALTTSCGRTKESLPYQFEVRRGPAIPYIGLHSYSAAYPNPAGNELIIDREETDNAIQTQNSEQNVQANNATVKVLLYSHSTTKLTYSKDFPASAQQIKIDTSQLPDGIYYLNIISNNEKIKEQTVIVNH